MKNISFLTAMAIAFSLTSCEEINPGGGQPNQVEINLKAAEIIDVNQQFAFELFSKVCSLSTEDNIMISPLSVSYALGMTYNGAAGTTLDAFNDVLHFGDLTRDEVNGTYKDLMGQLVTLDDQVEFSLANSIWYREGANVLADFIQRNQDYFEAAVEELDFADPASVDVINGWIEEQTNDKIKDMLDMIPPGAYMYLVNAVYFNANWKYEFDKDDTYTGSFTKEDGTTMDVDYMKMEGDFYFTVHQDYSAIELPYGDSAFSMVAILPMDKTISEFMENFDLEYWKSRDMFSSLQKVIFELPKFKYGFKSLLNDPLIDLGLGVAFSGGADFSGITNEADLFISRVIHQSFIDVMEEGTEAAAATIVEMRETSIGNFVQFNRPFLYLIKENSTGAIMFMGKVGAPEYE